MQWRASWQAHLPGRRVQCVLRVAQVEEPQRLTLDQLATCGGVQAGMPIDLAVVFTVACGQRRWWSRSA